MPRASLPAAPALTAAALAAALVAQLVLPWSEPPPETLPPRARAVPQSALPVPPVASRSIIAARNLFAPTRVADSPRGPVAGAGATAAAPPNPIDGATLLGTARGRNLATAVIRDAGGKVVPLRLGEALGGWRLIAVGQDTARMARRGEVRRLRLGVAVATSMAVPTGADANEIEEDPTR